jgi:ABC-type Fe3+-hydroxamate transport system substrate-binding protein
MHRRIALLALAFALVGSLVVAALAPAATSKTITGTDGPGFTITLKQRSKTVKLLAPGSYTFVINDMSNIHNFHLTGPGVNKKTGVGATGKFTWHVTLRRGTYKFVCDPHATIMKGKFIVQTP